mmetsp:Transcript_37960/g.41148  ORF Transcript_37960/g.41148 Transcript_37960/m.41148 type:complete len:97 (-) Transcript_37960:650-940(-)
MYHYTVVLSMVCCSDCENRVCTSVCPGVVGRGASTRTIDIDACSPTVLVPKITRGMKKKGPFYYDSLVLQDHRSDTPSLQELLACANKEVDEVMGK